MATPNVTRCLDCKYYLKVTHEYCYHPAKFGTLLDNPEKLPGWCPLKTAP